MLGPGFSAVSCTTLPELSTVTRTETLIWPRIVSRLRRGTFGISSWSTDGSRFANGCAGRSDGRETKGAEFESADFAPEEGAEVPEGADRGVSGFCEAAIGGAARCHEALGLRTC